MSFLSCRRGILGGGLGNRRSFIVGEFRVRILMILSRKRGLGRGGCLMAIGLRFPACFTLSVWLL